MLRITRYAEWVCLITRILRTLQPSIPTQSRQIPKRDLTLKVAHSTPIEWIAETGILGSLILSLMFLSIHSNWKNLHLSCKSDPYESIQYIKAHNNATIISMIGFWTGALFVSVLFWPFFWTLVLFNEMGNNVHSQTFIAKTGKGL